MFRLHSAMLRIPRHPATQSALIWPGIPRPSGH
ncbi:glutathione S-transferase, partial [Pseudomonas aeruginosa]|nr:glutathione S-transferase [Pseudomonas aeruginosa]